MPWWNGAPFPAVATWSRILKTPSTATHRRSAIHSRIFTSSRRRGILFLIADGFNEDYGEELLRYVLGQPSERVDRENVWHFCGHVVPPSFVQRWLNFDRAINNRAVGFRSRLIQAPEDATDGRGLSIDDWSTIELINCSRGWREDRRFLFTRKFTNFVACFNLLVRLIKEQLAQSCMKEQCSNAFVLASNILQQ